VRAVHEILLQYQVYIINDNVIYTSMKSTFSGLQFCPVQ